MTQLVYFALHRITLPVSASKHVAWVVIGIFTFVVECLEHGIDALFAYHVERPPS